MAKGFGWLLGIVFVIVGVLGLVGSGIVGPEGTFLTNKAHDLVHILTGIIFIVMTIAAANSLPTAFKVFGVVYLLVAVLGFFSQSGFVLGVVKANMADHWLHVVLGIVILAVGFMSGKKSMGMEGSTM